MTWGSVFAQDPQYLVLSSSLYAAPWVANLRRTQHLARLDPEPFSGRLYQDLLANDEPGPTKVQGVELMKIISASPPPIPWPGWNYPSQGGPIGWAMRVIWNTDAGLRRLIASLELTMSKPKEPVSGTTLRVYRLNPPGGPNGRPTAFASSEAPEYPARYAFVGPTLAWEAEGSDKSFASEYVGYDFGYGHARKANGIEIMWVTPGVTPSAFRVEYSDDRQSWVPVKSFAVAPYAPNDPIFRVDKFDFDETAEHRFWRVVDEDDRAVSGFGVADIRFLGGNAEDQ
jgi:hypothetical protein